MGRPTADRPRPVAPVRDRQAPGLGDADLRPGLVAAAGLGLASLGVEGQVPDGAGNETPTLRPDAAVDAAEVGRDPETVAVAAARTAPRLGLRRTGLRLIFLRYFLLGEVGRRLSV